jgi:hypothetical protein
VKGQLRHVIFHSLDGAWLGALSRGGMCMWKIPAVIDILNVCHYDMHGRRHRRSVYETQLMLCRSGWSWAYDVDPLLNDHPIIKCKDGPASAISDVPAYKFYASDQINRFPPDLFDTTKTKITMRTAEDLEHAHELLSAHPLIDSHVDLPYVMRAVRRSCSTGK